VVTKLLLFGFELFIGVLFQKVFVLTFIILKLPIIFLKKAGTFLFMSLIFLNSHLLPNV